MEHSINSEGELLRFPAPPVQGATRQRFQDRACIMEAGAPARHTFLIRRGTVRVYLLRENGHETTVAILGPGDVFGLSCLLGQQTYHAFAVALSAVDLWLLPPQGLVAALCTDAELAQAVVHALSRRVVLAQALVRGVGLLPVRERIPEALEWLRACLGEAVPALTREQLASLIGARAETVSRVSCVPKAA